MSQEVVFDKIHSQRLTQLADHLESDRPLGVGKFDFNVIYEDLGEGCGTAGCALGECRFLWPNEWGDPGVLQQLKLPGDFFGLTSMEVEHLFFPYQQKVSKFGGGVLGKRATRQDVAHNIREFLKIKGEESNV